MTSSDVLGHLFSKRRRHELTERDHLSSVFEALNHPYRSFPSIHVAGTNGKGSVATKIAKALEFAGYKAALFTSPHIQNFAERIQINGVPIPDRAIERLLPPLFHQFPEYCFFDYATFLAFQYFQEEKVDIAVLEAGIGGLHDTTNVITPLVSVITSISLDHVDLLGPTLDDIAYQKAGIIKPGVPVILGPQADLKLITDRAAFLKCFVIKVPGQPGDFDQENRAIARAALAQLPPHVKISEEAIQKGSLQKPPCRFERVGRFVMDVAHNVAGFETLLKAWQHNCPEKSFVAVMGFSLDKDIETCLRLMVQKAEHLFLVSAASAKAAPLQKLKEILERQRISHYTLCSTIREAVLRASESRHDVLICGSFYIMQEAREQISRLQIS